MGEGDDLDRYGGQQDIADVLGISQQAVSKHVRAGVVRKSGKRGYHIGRAVAAIRAARDPDKMLNGIQGMAAKSGVATEDAAARSGNGSPTGLLRARTAAAVLSAQKQDIELKRLKGELIPKSDVLAAIRTAQTVVIERLEGLPGLLAARVMQATSVPAAEQIIREAVRSLRRELSEIGEAANV